MDTVFTKKLKSTITCRHCKAEIPKKSLNCTACGARNTFPEFVAAIIIGSLGAMAMYALFQF